jgi:hypothetical protein
MQLLLFYQVDFHFLYQLFLSKIFHFLGKLTQVQIAPSDPKNSDRILSDPIVFRRDPTVGSLDLGNQFDICMIGPDVKSIYHENPIAQSLAQYDDNLSTIINRNEAQVE